MKVRWFLAPLLCVAVAIAVVMAFSFAKKQSILAQRSSLMAIARQYPRFTQAQRMAILREIQAERHPKWRDLSLSQMAVRLLQIATSASGSLQAPAAPFLGNLTVINSPSSTVLGLEREGNCTLTMGYASYTLNLPSLSYTVPTLTPDYDQVLHSEAGLTTTGGTWPAGCGDPVLGITSRSIVPLGTTTTGMQVGAAVGYNAATGNEVIYTTVGSPTQPATISTTVGELTIPNASPVAVVGADVNGDGNTDLIVVSDPTSASGTPSIAVLLANADGSFQSPVSYSLPGVVGLSAVIDDFNGDGKLDIVASSSSAIASTTATDSLTFLAGNGNGTFQAPVSVTVAPPAAFNSSTGTVPYFGLISASLRGNGTKDLVTSGGIVLLGNGNGTFTQLSTVAFPTLASTSEFGPNVVAGNFIKSGPIDLAVDNGESIALYVGNGDGTFTPGGGYAAIANTGYLNATDLDGDGNTDLYSGVAKGGLFGGDQFEIGQAYALMGNGNGTFQGAPEMPFVFTGTNLAKLSSTDDVPGGVGVTVSGSNVTFTSYLGNSNGSFSTGSTVTASPITISGTSYTLASGINSFGLGDTRGNGDADLVYIGEDFYGPGTLAGFFLATGEGNGSFNAPVFTPTPAFLPAGAPANDFDDSLTLSNLFVTDVNGDGKADLIYNYFAVDYYLNTYVQGVAVQLSNGDGTFQAPKTIQTYSSTTVSPPLQPQVVQVAATRASGVPDLFVLLQSVSNGSVTTQLELYLGNGDGTFGTAPTTPAVADNINQPANGTGPGQIVLADMNGDGKPDLITLGTTTNGGQGELAISLGNGDGTFQTPTILDFGDSSTSDYGLAAADFNGDGKMDVAVTGFNPPIDTGIFLGNGDGTVQSFSPSSGLVEPAEGIDLLVFGPSLAVDINGDGKPDLVAGSAVLLNLGTPVTTLIPTTTALTASATTLAAGTSLTLTATVSASTTPAGSVTFYDGTTALATVAVNGSGVATYSTSTLGVGTHSITAAFAAGSTFAGSTSTAVTITVTQPTSTATTTTLSASAMSITAGANVTLTDTVASTSGSGTPTGSVTFTDGTTPLQSVTLSNGTATYQTTTLPVGSNIITAPYSGDTNFSGSNSNAVTITVTAAAPSFTLGAAPSSATVSAGGSTQTTITVTPAGGFSSQVSFACTGLPTGGTCTFSPTTLTPSGAAATTTLTIATASSSGALNLPWRPGMRTRGVALAFMAAGMLWFFGRRRGSPWSRFLPLVVLMMLSAMVMACGGNSGGGGGGGGSQPQSYTVTITGTSGSQSPTTTFTLTVS